MGLNLSHISVNNDIFLCLHFWMYKTTLHTNDTISTYCKCLFFVYIFINSHFFCILLIIQSCSISLIRTPLCKSFIYSAWGFHVLQELLYLVICCFRISKCFRFMCCLLFEKDIYTYFWFGCIKIFLVFVSIFMRR